MRRLHLLPLALGLALAACQQTPGARQPSPGATGAAAGTDGVDLGQTVGQSGLVLREYMTHLVNNNANDLWKWQATVTDASGDHQTIPRDDDEWEEAESAALTLRELTRPLAVIGKGNATWEARYKALEVAVAAAAQHAEEKNGQAFYADGLAIDQACVACHHAFAPQLELPPRLKGGSTNP